MDRRYSIKLDQRLFFFHHGDGYFDDRGVEIVPEYRAEVGLLSPNVVVQGDDQSKQQQFGGQIVFASSQLYDDSIIGRLSNIETRNVGQGFEIRQVPDPLPHGRQRLSKSYVKNCTVHHANNRAIAIHGVNHLTVSWNVVFDTRGHAVFIEDGPEVRNTLSYNLVALVRPIWSLLLVDQSPACYWIVNPDNDVYAGTWPRRRRIMGFGTASSRSPTASRASPRRSRTRSSFRYIRPWRAWRATSPIARSATASRSRTTSRRSAGPIRTRSGNRPRSGTSWAGTTGGSASGASFWWTSISTA